VDAEGYAPLDGKAFIWLARHLTQQQDLLRDIQARIGSANGMLSDHMVHHPERK
jgi:hypothetical protein